MIIFLLMPAVPPPFTATAIPYSHLPYSLYRKLDIKGGDSTAVLAAGIPNISGSTRISTQSAALGCYWPEGVFYAKGNNNLGIPDANQTQPVSDLGFSAALSSNIYGASDTVQPPALSLIPQIKY